MMLERIYWFYDQLKAAANPSARDYKKRFEISPSTFKRDLAYFRDRLNAPVDYDPAVGGYRLKDPSFALPPNWFSPHHLLMMLGACRHLASVAAAIPPEVLRFQAQLETLLSRHYGQGVLQVISFENVAWSRCDSGLLDGLINAILERRHVRLTYHTGYTDQTLAREVEPYRLHNYRGTWHLIGHCHHRGLARVFMVGRILKAKALERRFEAPRFDAEAFLESSFGIYRGGALQPVSLRFSPAVAGIVADQIWHRDQRMVRLPDGGIRLTLQVADLTEIRQHVLMHGADVEVLAPAELRRQVRAAAEAVLKLYPEEKNKSRSDTKR